MIPDIEPVNNYYGNNTTTDFDFDFYIEDETQLTVTHTDYYGVQTELTYGVDYTIHETGSESGSYITFPIQGSAYSVLGWNTSTDKKEMLSVALTLPFSQEAEYEMSKDLNKKNLEKCFDKLTRMAQILRRGLSLAIKVPEGSSSTTADEYVNMLFQSVESAANSASAAAQSEANAAEQAQIATDKAAETESSYEEAMEAIAEGRKNIASDLSAAQEAIASDKTDALENINNQYNDCSANLKNQYLLYSHIPEDVVIYDLIQYPYYIDIPDIIETTSFIKNAQYEDEDGNISDKGNIEEISTGDLIKNASYEEI